MRVLCVIPARGGSKGLPDKNLQPIGGVPLVGWAVRAALSSRRLNGVYVSTDSSKIAKTAERYGAKVIRRPYLLAQDTTPTAPVIAHAVDALRSAGDPPDAILTLQCTSPLISGADIDAAIERLSRSAGCVVAVRRTDSLFTRSDGEQLRPIGWDFDAAVPRRQDRLPSFELFGAFCLTWADLIGADKPLYVRPVRCVEVPAERACDIDSPLDLYLAEALLSYRHTWVVVGASPSAPDHLARVLHRLPAAKTITTNSGIHLFDADPERLGVYFLSDSAACKRYAEWAKRRYWPHTRMVTLQREQSALESRGIEWFDELIVADRHDGPSPRFIPGRYTQSCGLSGLYCLQYAINHGARRVHLVGMEGYRGLGDGDYYAERCEPVPQSKRLAEHTRNLIGPFCRSVVEACPDVQFIFHGRLAYAVSGPNVWREV